MPKSAIPQDVLDRDWKGTDNDSWWQRIKKHWIQYPLAAGPNVPSGFWKWREIPKTLFEIHGEGVLRIENTDGTKIQRTGTMKFPGTDYWYLSRIQPWCRWHISLQWPLYFNCHVIYKAKNVVKYPQYQSAFGITKMFTFGMGFKRDGSRVYWLTANLGGNFE